MIRLPARTYVRRAETIAFAAIAVWMAVGGAASADEPLHVRIDRLIEVPLLVTPAPLADDAEFLRRLSLDLRNRIASADEVRSFLQDRSAGKRNDVIERMVASPQQAASLPTR